MSRWRRAIRFRKVSVCQTYRLFALVLTWQAFAADTVTAQDTDWKTGPSFQQALDRQTQVTWRGSPLREAVVGLSENQQVAIFLDRRVDPDQRIEFVSGEGTLEQLLQKLCNQLDLEFAEIDSLIYIGPPGCADRIASMSNWLAESLRDYPSSVRAKWFSRRPFHWAMLAEPKALLEEWTAASDIRLEGIDLVPHDLWADQSLPELRAIDGLVVLLGGFDLTAEIEPESQVARIIPLPERVTYEKSHRIPNGVDVDLAELRRFFVECEITRRENRILFIGSAREHGQLADGLMGKPVSRPAERVEEKTYTIRETTTQAGNVIATIADQLTLTIRYEGDAAERLTRRVRVDVTDVSIDELLRTVLDPLALEYVINETVIVIRPAR